MPHRPLPPGHLLQWMDLQGHVIAGPSFLAFDVGVIRALPLAPFSSILPPLSECCPLKYHIFSSPSLMAPDLQPPASHYASS